jgi:phytanoyl-CoA hydroxylase
MQLKCTRQTQTDWPVWEASMMEATAAVDINSDAAGYYREYGYVVVRQLISSAAITKLLDAYTRDILPSKSRFYRQNTDRYEPNRLSSSGFVEQAFLDIHAYKRYPAFRAAALTIFFSPELRQALTRIDGSADHNLMQSMLFDANTATPPHQDWWYLDSVPGGNLLAAWIALEDIHEDAGRFFVIPGSHRLVLHDPDMKMPHSEWLARVRRYVDTHQTQVRAPALQRGDVLFWNSRTIHGSLKTLDSRHSRKSLTAHFLPSTMQFGNLFTTKPWVNYERHEGHLYFANQPEYSLRSMLVTKLKLTLYDRPQLLKLARKLQRGGVSDY